MTLEQFRLFPEGSHESRAAAHATQGFTRLLTQLPEVLGTEVRQFMLLPVPPQVFDGFSSGASGGAMADRCFQLKWY